MILDRLDNNGVINENYRLDFIKQKNEVEKTKKQAKMLNLFD
jgi:hypothetical protein